jgi:hypothetical protein
LSKRATRALATEFINWIMLLEDVKIIHAFKSSSSQMLCATADLTIRDLITTFGVNAR